MLISTKQRAQSIQLLPDKNPEITSAYSNRSSSPRSSCSSTSSSSSSSTTTDNNNNNTVNTKSVPMSLTDQSSTDEATTDNTKNKNVLATEAEKALTAPVQAEDKEEQEEVEATEEEDNAKADTTSINENEDDLLEDDCEEEGQESVVDAIYDYWKNFDIQKLKNDLNEQIDEILRHQKEHDKLNLKYSQLNEDLERQNSNEDILKTVKSFQQDLAKSVSRCKLTERTSIDLLKLIGSVPDPFRAIELAKSQLQEQGSQYEQIERLRSENTKLKERLTRRERNESSESGGDSSKSELVYHLSEQVGRTTQLNLELTSKLKLAEGEIDSYKRILAEYQNEISDMKVKHLNEIKSEYHKDSDRNTRSKIDSVSEAANKVISGINNSSLSATSTSSKSDKLTNLSETKTNTSQNKQQASSTAFKPIEANNNNTENSKMNANDTAYDSANEEYDENECDESLLHTSSTNASSNNNNPNSSFEPINTADIAQKVRDLLSIHNIGQRVFAKFILGLSQGTVSELLSKPKHWDKLTEKGRESYRKMYNWSCSEQSISTLKAISPRKGNKDNYFYQGSNGVAKEEPSTEDRINQILGEAQKQMLQKQSSQQQRGNLSGSPSPSNSSAISPSNTDGSPSMSPNAHQDLLQRMLLNTYNNAHSNNNNNGYENDDETTEADESMNEEDMVSSQYHRKSQSQKRSSDESFPLDLTTSRLSANMNKSAMDINCKKVKIERHDLMLESDDGENSTECNNNINNSNKPNKNFSLRNNKATNNNNTTALNASPLKHIQSIADAYLISQLDQAGYKSFQQQSPSSTNSFQRPSSTPSPSLSNSGNNNTTSTGASTGSKALKSILPPVSQEQFDRYSFINTEELVKKVKDLLSKFSISQRLFGECILGLSQGSVSDLLARPKPWQMLTQKGREPFIRMQMFIDDPEAIKKLMANQYKAPAEHKTNHSSRSNSSHSLLNGSNNASFDTAKDSLQKIVSQTLSQNLNGLQNAQSLSAMFANISHTQNLLNLSQQQFQQAAIAAAAASAVNAVSANTSSSTNNDNSNDSEVKTNNQFQTQINIIPYDISTMSAVGDLNTEEITNRVKETLLNNNIGQKLFGEAVLNLSQGTVSELLSKPKPWNTLSIKGREPYLRMYMWLNDLMRLEKLTEWKEEKNLLKRNSTEVESDHQKPKRRFIFSEDQKEQLMKAFKYDPYPAVNQMEALANKLNLQTRTVINWFHNHRMRIRYKNSTSQAGSSNNASNTATAHNENNSNNHITQVTSRSRSTNQFNEFTKSLPHYSNSNNKTNNNNRSSSSNGSNNMNNSNNSHLANSFYANQFSNNSRNNEEEYDDEEYNNIDEPESQKDVESDLEPTRTKAALALLNNAYNLPKYFSTHKQQYENDGIKHDISEMEDDEEEEELDGHENNESLQDDLEDTDHEAEINSMYIPGDKNHQGYEDGEEEDPEEMNQNNNNIYMSQYASSPSETSSRHNQLITNSNTNNNTNKRRKPHNPQKISFALNLLNLKLEKQQQQQQRAACAAQVSASDDQDVLNE